jgi:hypothetical protein
MTESIFSKVYSYREREGNNPKENFLIEIFAHCLQVDNKLLTDFFSKLNLIADDQTTIRTQATYEYGRPDIEINIPTSKTCILIECKIEHFERENQLEDYKKILEEKKISNRHLVYLTKYYDFREDDNKAIKLHILKWTDIYNIIDDDNTELSQELKSYLKDEHMDESKNFTYTDLTVLKNAAGTIRKMNEVIDGVKEYYEKKIGPFAKESSRSTRLKEEWYVATHSVGQPYKFEIEIGFIWWWDEQVYLGIRIYLPTADKFKNTENYCKLFKKYLKDWEFEDDWDKCFVFGKYQPVGQFIIDEEEQVPAMVQYLRELTDELDGLKKVDPKIFK